MKIVKIIFLLSLISTLAYSQSEENGILNTVNDYLDGGTNGNVSQFKGAFVKDAVQRSIGRSGNVIGMTVESLASKLNPGKTMSRETRVVSWSYAGISATAITETTYPSSKIIDMLNLLKIDGEWKIVSRVYSRIGVDENISNSAGSTSYAAKPRAATAVKSAPVKKKKVEAVEDDGW